MFDMNYGRRRQEKLPCGLSSHDDPPDSLHKDKPMILREASRLVFERIWASIRVVLRKPNGECWGLLLCVRPH